jgi:hypothetical protein
LQPTPQSDANPYSPPTADNWRALPVDFQPGLLRRRGSDLLVWNGAALPPLCFVTGEPTDFSLAFRQSWHPRWVYWWLLAGIAPYFLVAPTVSRSIALKVPLSRSVYSSHMKLVRKGLRWMLLGAGMFTVAVVASPVSTQAKMLFVPSVLVGAIGFLMSSRQPVPLHIVRLDADLLVLRNIHPKCLEGIPDESSA